MDAGNQFTRRNYRAFILQALYGVVKLNYQVLLRTGMTRVLSRATFASLC
jgi:hypothetical protein